MLELVSNFFTSKQFIPHGHCYLWKPDLVWLHIISDSLIAVAYYSIPIMLVYFIHKRRDMPFQGIFLMFGAFIVSCGTTHLMEVWTLWHPTYWLSGILKLVTAMVSLYTAVKLYFLTPQALALPSPAQLEATNQKLAQEIIERQQAEVALRDSEALFRSIFEGAAIGIALVDMAGKPVATNPALQRMVGDSENNWDGICFKDLVAGRSDYYHSKRYLGKDTEMQEGSDWYQMEKRYLSKDGQLLWCNITVSLVRDVEDKPQYSIRMVENITERKQAEAALRRYQEHLEEMVAERTVELTKANEQLFWQANHDELTGLVNRHAFEQRLEEAVVSARTQNQEHTLCYLDLDRFKIVNDTCGHLAGDELLRQVSALLKTKCRKSDILGRLGGDEFALLLYQCSKEEALRVAQSILESINLFRFVWCDKPFNIGVSIGLVAINANSHSLESVLGAADAACYVAKNTGRNRVRVYQAGDGEVAQQHSELQWVARIHQAMVPTQPTVNRFCLYQQPIVPIASQGANAEYCEILLRLVDETGNVAVPMAFFPAAERYNLMPSIDRWVIRTLFSHLSAVRAQQLVTTNNGRLYAINLSEASIKDDQFISFLKEQFLIHRIPAAQICFQITETTAIANLSQVSQLSYDLRTLGCRFSLDDFGSGLSSLVYLKHLPVNYLKIAENFVKDTISDPVISTIVEAINRIGHLMGVETIANEVSNDIILNKIKTLGVDYVQGGIAPPQLIELQF